jgi:mono/diheme cytochrome c family protein
MKRRLVSYLFVAALLAGVAGVAPGHDVITTKITFDREIIRIVYARCASCHREGGSAFSLTTYDEARPWAKAMQEEVLEQRMPPWGAVKGFGEFRDDQALTPEQIELVADWVEGGAPEGEPKDLPKPPVFTPVSAQAQGPRQPVQGGDFKLTRALKLAGIQPEKVAADVSFQVTAELPDGSIQPLLWLQPFKSAYSHPFWFRSPLSLPPGTVIHGVPQTTTVSLLLSH